MILLLEIEFWSQFSTLPEYTCVRKIYMYWEARSLFLNQGTRSLCLLQKICLGAKWCGAYFRESFHFSGSKFRWNYQLFCSVFTNWSYTFLCSFPPFIMFEWYLFWWSFGSCRLSCMSKMVRVCVRERGRERHFLMFNARELSERTNSNI